jgi:hypothetical protein
MGGGRFDPQDWQNYATTQNYATKSAAQIYTSSRMFKDFDPKNVKNGIRESVDSVDNPTSTPIIVGLDVTGSMETVLEAMAKQGLKTLFEEIYKRKPVKDPHVLVAAIGDAYCDSAPLQVSQFEADLRIAEQLEKLFLERGGGGNGSEGYGLVHYFAAKHTKVDSFEKRKKKGYLFTIGDDGPTPEVTAEQLRQFIGDVEPEDYTAEQLLTMASKQWEIFHLMVTEGETHSAHVEQRWRKLLGERALLLTDHTKMAEVIVSTIQVLEGATAKDVTKSWDGSTGIVVGKAIKDLAGVQKNKGVVTL